MNWKTWIPLVLAVVLGVVAAKVARDVIVRGRGMNASAAKLTKIVVAKEDVTPGKELKAEDLILSQVDADHVPNGSFTQVADLEGRVTEQLMVKGQTVLEPMLAPTGSTGGLQALVPTGMRAITVEVNEFSAVGGMLIPGSRVDVISTIQNNGEQMSRTIVQNVKITATGQRTANMPNPQGETGPEMYKSVTMLCTPEEAEAIELANAIGRPRLVLRSSRDTQLSTTEGITLGELRKGLAKMDSDPFGGTRNTSTTQPSGAFEGGATERRSIKVIRAGVESSVSMMVEPRRIDTADTDGSALFD